jgi:type I restriction enzyme, S subunit
LTTFATLRCSQSHGIPFIKAKHITNGFVDFDNCDYITYDDHLKVISRSKPEKGDILFTHIGASLGVTAYIKEDIEFSIKNIALFKPDAEKIISYYLYYLIISHQFQSGILNQRTGSAQPFVSLQMLREFEILYHPEMKIQKLIVDIVSTYDRLIENNTRRIKILEEMAQNLYREWFVNFRFPGHEQTKLIDSSTDLGQIPEGWEVVKLQKLAFVNQNTLKLQNAPVEIDYIDIASVSTGTILEIQKYAFADAPGRARRIVQHGDIIWSCVRPNRKSHALILNPQSHLIVSTGFAVISPKLVPYSYLYQALITTEFVDYLTNNATGSAYPAVNAKDFNNANVLLPDAEILKIFHRISDQLYILKQNLQKKNSVLQRTRDLLLPKLISGEIDVESLDIDKEAIAA